METIIAVGETRYVSFDKVDSIKDQVWEWVDLENYCDENNIVCFTLDDYCDAVNGISSEDCSIDFSNVNISYCYVNF